MVKKEEYKGDQNIEIIVAVEELLNFIGADKQSLCHYYYIYNLTLLAAALFYDSSYCQFKLVIHNQECL